MSQVFGVFCSTDSLTGSLLEQFGSPLEAFDPSKREALGIGWLQDGRSLVRKHPSRLAQRADLLPLLADIPCRGVIGQVRHVEEGKSTLEDLQPFRYRNFVFALSGESQRLVQSAQELRGDLPDHIARNLQGSTGAEIFFHYFYTLVEARVSSTARQEWHQCYEEALGVAFGHLRDQPLSALCLSDRVLLAATGEAPLFYRLVDGLEEDAEKPLFAGHKPKRVKHPQFRGFLISGGHEVEQPEWKRVPPNSTLRIDQDWKVSIREIGKEK